MMPSALHGHLQRILTRVSGFDDLASRCLGAWPPDIIEALISLADLGGVDGDLAEWLLEDARAKKLIALHSDMELPLEHPLDSDWRFEAEERARLLDQLVDRLAPTDRILAVCAPTIVHEAGRRGIGSRMVVGIRSKDPVMEALKKLVPDAEYVPIDQLIGTRAAAGIIDPPWQDHVAKPLVERLLSGLRVGARVLISGPDLLTSANAVSSLRTSHGSPSWPGLSSTRPPLRVRYKTPRFEARALLAAGISNIPPVWRTGLVHSYRKAHEFRFHSQLVTNSDWTEVLLEGHRIWRRLRGNGVPAHIRVSDSVSSQNPLRQTATVWTSGNTIVTGGALIDLDGLSQTDVDGHQAEFRQRLLHAEECSCWQPPGVEGVLLAAQAAQCENWRMPVAAGVY